MKADNIEYYILNPAGNITALVTSDTAKADYKTVAAGIFKSEPEVEQAGFVKFRQNGVNLNMSGDEFCGNATMSAAALYYSLNGAIGTEKIPVTVLPYSYAVNVTVNKSGGAYVCEGLFKSPNEVKSYSFGVGGREYTFPLVCFEGIMHVVADGSLSPALAGEIIKKAAADLKAPALGIMIFDRITCSLTPIVYVTAVDTLFCENSCASGCCAVASVMPEFSQMTDIVQNGGIIAARLENGGIHLKTSVKIERKCAKENDYAKKDCF